MNKKVVVILLILVACCCATVLVGAGLFGSFYVGTTCQFKGPLASVSDGPCAPVVSSSASSSVSGPVGMLDAQTTYDGRNATKFTFKYDAQLMTLNDDPSTSALLLTLTAKDYSKFQDNLNITSSSAITLTSTYCQQYGETVVSQLQSQFTVDSSSFKSAIERVNGNDVCHVSWASSSQGVGFEQNQYLFTNTTDDRTYIITVSTETAGSNQNLFDAVLESFTLN